MKTNNLIWNFIYIPVSNEVPEHPVVSPVSGAIYEKRLIEKYIAENASDPMNGEKLSVDMLIEVKSKFSKNTTVLALPCIFRLLLVKFWNYIVALIFVWIVMVILSL